jgi:putative membrane protein
MLRLGSLSLAVLLLAGASSLALAKTEKEFISDAIKGDNSEIAMGHLAISKSASDAVKAFGQTLIDGHSKAKTDASAVATAMGVSPPSEMSSEAQQEMTRLQQLAGRDLTRNLCA